MRATGIVRRIDDLGRVVIPKELRKNLNIKDGDPLEIFTIHEEGKEMVVFCKYEEDTMVHIEQNELEKLYSQVERLKEDVIETSPSGMISDLEDIMETIRQLLPED